MLRITVLIEDSFILIFLAQSSPHPKSVKNAQIMFGDTKPVELDHLRPEKFEGHRGVARIKIDVP